jgi:hypothetical protein
MDSGPDPPSGALVGVSGASYLELSDAVKQEIQTKLNELRATYEPYRAAGVPQLLIENALQALEKKLINEAQYMALNTELLSLNDTISTRTAEKEEAASTLREKEAAFQAAESAYTEAARALNQATQDLTGFRTLKGEVERLQATADNAESLARSAESERDAAIAAYSAAEKAYNDAVATYEMAKALNEELLLDYESYQGLKLEIDAKMKAAKDAQDALTRAAEAVQTATETLNRVVVEYETLVSKGESFETDQREYSELVESYSIADSEYKAALESVRVKEGEKGGAETALRTATNAEQAAALLLSDLELDVARREGLQSELAICRTALSNAQSEYTATSNAKENIIRQLASMAGGGGNPIADAQEFLSQRNQIDRYTDAVAAAEMELIPKEIELESAQSDLAAIEPQIREGQSNEMAAQRVFSEFNADTKALLDQVRATESSRLGMLRSTDSLREVEAARDRALPGYATLRTALDDLATVKRDSSSLLTERTNILNEIQRANGTGLFSNYNRDYPTANAEFAFLQKMSNDHLAAKWDAANMTNQAVLLETKKRTDMRNYMSNVITKMAFVLFDNRTRASFFYPSTSPATTGGTKGIPPTRAAYDAILKKYGNAIHESYNTGYDASGDIYSIISGVGNSNIPTGIKTGGGPVDWYELANLIASRRGTNPANNWLSPNTVSGTVTTLVPRLWWHIGTAAANMIYSETFLTEATFASYKYSARNGTSLSAPERYIELPKYRRHFQYLLPFLTTYWDNDVTAWNTLVDQNTTRLQTDWINNIDYKNHQKMLNATTATAAGYMIAFLNSGYGKSLQNGTIDTTFAPISYQNLTRFYKGSVEELFSSSRLGLGRLQNNTDKLSGAIEKTHSNLRTIYTTFGVSITENATQPVQSGPITPAPAWVESSGPVQPPSNSFSLSQPRTDLPPNLYPLPSWKDGDEPLHSNTPAILLTYLNPVKWWYDTWYDKYFPVPIPKPAEYITLTTVINELNTLNTQFTTKYATNYLTYSNASISFLTSNAALWATQLNVDIYGTALQSYNTLLTDSYSGISSNSNIILSNKKLQTDSQNLLLNTINNDTNLAFRAFLLGTNSNLVINKSVPNTVYLFSNGYQTGSFPSSDTRKYYAWSPINGTLTILTPSFLQSNYNLINSNINFLDSDKIKQSYDQLAQVFSNFNTAPFGTTFSLLNKPASLETAAQNLLNYGYSYNSNTKLLTFNDGFQINTAILRMFNVIERTGYAYNINRYRTYAGSTLTGSNDRDGSTVSNLGTYTSVESRGFKITLSERFNLLPQWLSKISTLIDYRNKYDEATTNINNSMSTYNQSRTRFQQAIYMPASHSHPMVNIFPGYQSIRAALNNNNEDWSPTAPTIDQILTAYSTFNFSNWYTTNFTNRITTAQTNLDSVKSARTNAYNLLKPDLNALSQQIDVIRANLLKYMSRTPTPVELPKVSLQISNPISTQLIDNALGFLNALKQDMDSKAIQFSGAIASATQNLTTNRSSFSTNEADLLRRIRALEQKYSPDPMNEFTYREEPTGPYFDSGPIYAYSGNLTYIFDTLKSNLQTIQASNKELQDQYIPLKEAYDRAEAIYQTARNALHTASIAKQTYMNTIIRRFEYILTMAIVSASGPLQQGGAASGAASGPIPTEEDFNNALATIQEIEDAFNRYTESVAQFKEQLQTTLVTLNGQLETTQGAITTSQTCVTEKEGALTTLTTAMNQKYTPSEDAVRSNAVTTAEAVTEATTALELASRNLEAAITNKTETEGTFTQASNAIQEKTAQIVQDYPYLPELGSGASGPLTLSTLSSLYEKLQGLIAKAEAQKGEAELALVTAESDETLASSTNDSAQESYLSLLEEQERVIQTYATKYGKNVAKSITGLAEIPESSGPQPSGPIRLADLELVNTGVAESLESAPASGAIGRIMLNFYLSSEDQLKAAEGLKNSATDSLRTAEGAAVTARDQATTAQEGVTTKQASLVSQYPKREEEYVAAEQAATSRATSTQSSLTQARSNVEDARKLYGRLDTEVAQLNVKAIDTLTQQAQLGGTIEEKLAELATFNGTIQDTMNSIEDEARRAQEQQEAAESAAKVAEDMAAESAARALEEAAEAEMSLLEDEADEAAQDVVESLEMERLEGEASAARAVEEEAAARAAQLEREAAEAEAAGDLETARQLELEASAARADELAAQGELEALMEQGESANLNITESLETERLEGEASAARAVEEEAAARVAQLEREAAEAEAAGDLETARQLELEASAARADELAAQGELEALMEQGEGANLNITESLETERLEGEASAARAVEEEAAARAAQLEREAAEAEAAGDLETARQLELEASAARADELAAQEELEMLAEEGEEVNLNITESLETERLEGEASAARAVEEEAAARAAQLEREAAEAEAAGDLETARQLELEASAARADELAAQEELEMLAEEGEAADFNVTESLVIEQLNAEASAAQAAENEGTESFYPEETAPDLVIEVEPSGPDAELEKLEQESKDAEREIQRALDEEKATTTIAPSVPSVPAQASSIPIPSLVPSGSTFYGTPGMPMMGAPQFPSQFSIQFPAITIQTGDLIIGPRTRSNRYITKNTNTNMNTNNLNENTLERLKTLSAQKEEIRTATRENIENLQRQKELLLKTIRVLPPGDQAPHQPELILNFRTLADTLEPVLQTTVDVSPTPLQLGGRRPRDLFREMKEEFSNLKIE